MRTDAPAPRNPFYHRQGITDPRHFFGREETVRGLLEMVASGQSCAVVGERRVGKTSLLCYLSDPRVQAAHGVEAERTATAVLDFLALSTCAPEELWIEILEALEYAATDPRVEELLARTLERGEVSFTDLRRTLRRLRRLGHRVVLLCDEFELAVENPRFDPSFFGALRSLAGHEGVAFVTASRLSLLELGQFRSEEERRQVLGSPFFNIFAEFILGPFDDREMNEMLAGALAATEVRFDAADVALLDRLAGRHPYFLQLAGYHLYADLARGRRSSGVEQEGHRDVHRRVRDNVERESAKIFRDQLQLSSSEERAVLFALAARSPAGPVGKQAHAEVLDRLERRCLVRSISAPDSSARSSGGGELLRHYRLFSEVFEDWLLRQASPRTEPAKPRRGTTDRYTVLEEVGRGGAGTVYKAWDERLERVVALKVLHPETRSSEDLRRLLDEARASSALLHPNIVIVHDIDVDEGRLVSEFMAGGSLRDLLEEVSTLDERDVVSLGEQLARALAAAHDAGVVHRDLKPENVLLASRPKAVGGPRLPAVKLGDFGTALRLSGLDQDAERPQVAGTVAYMAPEQRAGEEVGPEVDFYSLGVVLHEARSGLRPSPGGVMGAARALISREAEGIEAALDALVLRCLAERPGDRFGSVHELVEALAAVTPYPSPRGRGVAPK